ncbi:MAG: hypothetical protein V1769_04705 [Thermoplasmatota archaeon]
MVSIEHIALECDTLDHAIMLFEKVFDCTLVKSFSLSEDFVEQVFSVHKSVDVHVYRSSFGVFEVFITGVVKHEISCQHICIGIPDMARFVSSCKNVGLEPYTIIRNEKQYTFLRDMVGNVFEIKEMK